jgi:hypothetical protein
MFVLPKQVVPVWTLARIKAVFTDGFHKIGAKAFCCLRTLWTDKLYAHVTTPLVEG